MLLKIKVWKIYINCLISCSSRESLLVTENEEPQYSRTGHAIRKGLAWLFTILLCTASVYIIWGWITIEDIHKYCATNGLDFEKTLSSLVSDTTIGHMEGNEKGYTLKDIHSGSDFPLYRYLAPFSIHSYGEKGFSLFTGAILEPFLIISENSRNVVSCFGIGYLVGILIIGLESLKGSSISIRRLLLRPMLGGTSAALLFIVILSGGSLIWNEVNGAKGLSLGLIAVIGSLLCEKFSDLIGVSA